MINEKPKRLNPKRFGVRVGESPSVRNDREHKEFAKKWLDNPRQLELFMSCYDFNNNRFDKQAVNLLINKYGLSATVARQIIKFFNNNKKEYLEKFREVVARKQGKE